MKNILITGGSGGIGQEICKRFLSLGYRVCFFYNNGEKVAKSLQDLGAIGYKVDITSEQQIKSAITSIKEKYGLVSAVINCVGITKRALLLDCAEEDFNQIFSVNVKGVFTVCKNLIWDVVKTCGDIINLSSIWASRPASCEVLYSASKGAIESFTRSLADELSYSGAKVNAISLGYVDTAINKGITKEQVQDFLQSNNLKRVVTPLEVASLCEQIILSNKTGKIYELFGN